ncbi:MAG: carboxylesterase family protein, partial [Candidatus Hydrogenedentes bacterium]|nr:carboxylesterase family protein [Candidatus Hydrogenedentota bacterium]
FVEKKYPVKVTSNVVYGTGIINIHIATPGSRNLLVDVYEPDGPDAPTTRPGFVMVHGGGWISGSKDNVGGSDTFENPLIPGDFTSPTTAYANAFASRGYTVISVDYRMALDFPLGTGDLAALGGDASLVVNGIVANLLPFIPWYNAVLALNAYEAGLRDTQLAFQWLSDNAAVYGVDSTRIALGGYSAGAINSLVSAMMMGTPAAALWLNSGGVDIPNIPFISPSSPPTIFFQGTNDPLVDFSFAVNARDTLLGFGVPVEFNQEIGEDHWYTIDSSFDLPGTVEERIASFMFTHMDLATVPVVAPIASAGANQTVECASSSGTLVALDGSGSSDADSTTGTNDGIASYSWQMSGIEFATGEVAFATLPDGNHTITLVVTDLSGLTSQDTTLVTIQDTTNPTLTIPDDLTAECTSTSGTPVSIGTATATDTCGAVTVSNDAPAVFPFGSTTVTWSAEDAAGNFATANQIVTVVDTTAPSLTVALDNTSLWPPSHKMIEIVPTLSASDTCDASPSVTLMNITMNEGDETLTYDPLFDDTLGDGNTLDDIQVDSSGRIFLRAERSGKGDGRIYTLSFQATDATGNQTIATATVTVAKSQ